MKSNYKPSISSRASVRSLIVACLPAAAVTFVANSPVLGAVFAEPANHGLTVDDNNGATTNIPGTNSSSTTNRPPNNYNVAGLRG